MELNHNTAPFKFTIICTKYELPNVVVGIMTRESILGAYDRGITPEQVNFIEYINKNVCL